MGEDARASRSRLRIGHPPMSRRLALLAAAALATTTAVPIALASGNDGCALGAKLVPSCGALWGISVPNDSPTGVANDERLVNRKFDIVHVFDRLGEVVPTSAER